MNYSVYECLTCRLQNSSYFNLHLRANATGYAKLQYSVFCLMRFHLCFFFVFLYDVHHSFYKCSVLTAKACSSPSQFEFNFFYGCINQYFAIHFFLNYYFFLLFSFLKTTLLSNLTFPKNPPRHRLCLCCLV